MSAELLPSNSSPAQRALAAALDLMPDLLPGVEQIQGWKHVRQPSDLRPFLVDEYGLAVLSPYLANYADILALGLPWSRVRGTHAAVAQGLAMLGYQGTLSDPPARRRAWAEFQIDLDRVRDRKEDLGKLAGIVNLSIPERSTFRRGVHGYDVPAAETGWARLSGALLSDDSGVRIDGAGPKWSFGRSMSFEHTFSETDLTALDIWIPEIDSPKWADMDFPWQTAGFKWSDDLERARRVALATSLEEMPVWLRFADAADATIGYRKAVCHGVEQGLAGYPFGSGHLAPGLDNPIGIYLFARTDFGDGSGSEAASVSVLFNAAVTDPARPGRLWLDPAGLTGGMELATKPVSISFGESIREHLQFLMRF
ncbi:phage tail protein [Labrenzia sp. OB1]|uniref:phage tail protein n=1 Tax=Labrenzia sp. OB1 TaxID=1561204 RepID=UPI0007B218BF|nr:phage tail protein [Labrenzia sp. OB1]KZM49449.1 hypothetical protein OA90_15350 [Labrenzia sp. OB1]